MANKLKPKWDDNRIYICLKEHGLNFTMVDGQGNREIITGSGAAKAMLEMREAYESMRADDANTIATQATKIQESYNDGWQMGYEKGKRHDFVLINRLEDTIATQAAQLQELSEAVGVLKLVYRKHFMDDASIGWDELGEKVLDALSNTMGVEELVKWQEAMSNE